VDQRRPAGVIAWRALWDDYWLLDLLASSLGHRDEDVAKRLYRRLIERASEEDIGLIFSSVDRRNVR